MYTHLSKKRIQLAPCCYLQYQSRAFKPVGLWFEVDGDWRRWCEDENFHLDCLVITHELEFNHERVLFLMTARELDIFTERYPKVLHPDIADIYAIDWERVAKQYAGIVIAPYCWERRLDLMWYYEWDCASGCIWDLSIITRFEVVPTLVKTPEEVTHE